MTCLSEPPLLGYDLYHSQAAMSLSPAPDPDPTTQMTWLTSTSSVEGLNHSDGPNPDGVGGHPVQQERYRDENRTRHDPKAFKADQTGRRGSDDANKDIGTTRLTSWQLFNLSVSMAGAQVAWTVELG